jgi:hypothetical protein
MRLTGFQPFDNIIMDSAAKADKIIADFDYLEGQDLLDYAGAIDIESLTGNDVARILMALQKRGVQISC